MKAIKLTGYIVALGLLVVSAIMADEPMTEGQPMIETGPPQEIQAAASIVGTWKYAGDMRMQPGDTVWMHHEATVEFSLVSGGAAIQMVYTGEIMDGIEMHGLSLTTYDREMKQWQEIWTDNYAARMSMYTGHIVDGKRIMTGTDIMGGMKFHTRTTSFNITDDAFDWTMEHSEDGENWWVSMKGHYTRAE